MQEEKVGKDGSFRDGHRWAPLELFIRELVLCNTKDEFFKEFILYETRVFDKDNIEIAEFRFHAQWDMELYRMLEGMHAFACRGRNEKDFNVEVIQSNFPRPQICLQNI